MNPRGVEWPTSNSSLCFKSHFNYRVSSSFEKRHSTPHQHSNKSDSHSQRHPALRFKRVLSSSLAGIMGKAVIADNAQTLSGSCWLGQSILNWHHAPLLCHTTIPKTRSQKWSMDYLAVRASNNGVNAVKLIYRDHKYPQGIFWEWNNGGQPKEADSALETRMGIGRGAELIPLIWTALVLVGTSWRKATHAPILFCHTSSHRQQAAPHWQWFQTQKVQRSFLWTYSPCTRLLQPHSFFPAFHHFSSTSHFSSVKPPLAVGSLWREARRGAQLSEAAQECETVTSS